MSTNETLQVIDSADYYSIAADDAGGSRLIVGTDGAGAFRRHMEKMKLIERRLDEAYAGCVLINLLLDHPVAVELPGRDLGDTRVRRSRWHIHIRYGAD